MRVMQHKTEKKDKKDVTQKYDFVMIIGFHMTQLTNLLAYEVH